VIFHQKKFDVGLLSDSIGLQVRQLSVVHYLPAGALQCICFQIFHQHLLILPAHLKQNIRVNQLGLMSKNAKSRYPESIVSNHTVLYPGSGFSGLEFTFQVTCLKYGICSGKGPPGHVHAIVHANTSKSCDGLVETPNTETPIVRLSRD